MKLRIQLLSLLVFLVAGGRPASAQTYRGEVFGSLGAGRYEKGGLFGPTSWGWGVNVGGGIGIRPFSPDHFWLRGLGVEFELHSTRDRASDGSSRMWTSYTGNALYHFRVRGTEPYVVLGGGRSYRGDESAGAFVAGTGVKVFLNEHVSLRPEFRLTLTGLGFLDTVGSSSVAIGYHW